MRKKNMIIKKKVIKNDLINNKISHMIELCHPY
jgi:hypothetical protein